MLSQSLAHADVYVKLRMPIESSIKVFVYTCKSYNA